MNLKHALYIMKILEEGSITAAARAMHISQPSLSQTVRAAEEELGIPIFDRSSKKITLTPAGQKYIKSMQEILDVERRLKAELAELKGAAPAPLRLGVSAQRCISLMPQLLSEFLRLHPNISIELKEMPSVHLEDFLLSGGCDAAFITTFPKANGLEYRLVENEQIVLMASKKTALARSRPEGAPLELEAARDESFISLTQGHSVRSIQDRLSSLRGVRLRILMELSTMEAAKLITPTLNAVMICPYGYVQGDSRVQSLVSCYPLNCRGFERHFYFCRNRKTPSCEALNDLFDIARRICSRHTCRQEQS